MFRSRRPPHRHPLLGGLVLGLALAVGGCAAGGSPLGGTSSPSLLDKLFAADPAPEPEPERKAERKPGCGSPAQCRSALKAMVESPKRGWVGQQMPPEAYADGTRLFAYRALRKKLNCRELSLAVSEVRSVANSLSGAVPGLTSDQVTRTRALNSQVEGELAQERSTRCRA